MSSSRVRSRLRSLRLRRNYTQIQLAKAVGVSRQTIIAIEKEQFAPSTKLALRLARELKVPLEEIFWLEDDGESSNFDAGVQANAE